MPYTLEMPDGTRIEDIPDDVDPKVAGSKWIDSVFKNSESRLGTEVPTDNIEAYGVDLGGAGTTLAGIGRGMTNVGQNVGQMLVPEQFEEQLGVSDADRAMRDERDAPLMDTAGGTAGELIGEVALTAPVGAGVAGLGVKGLGMAAQGASRLPGATKAAQLASKGLTGLSGSRTARYGLEGAVEGALVNDDMIEGAKEGALFGAGSGLAAGALGKLGKGFAKSDEAKRLQELTGVDAPISMSADSRAVRETYNKLLPFFPGTGGLSKQADEASDAIRKMAAQAASPEGVAASSVSDVARNLEKGYLDGVGKRTINMVDNAFDDVPVPDRVVNKANKIINEYVEGGAIKGDTAHVIRARLSKLVDDNPLDSAYRGILEHFDKKVIADLSRSAGKKATPANQKIIDSYKAMNKSFDGFKQLGAGTDEITQLANKMDDNVSSRNIFQKLAANAVVRSIINLGTLGGTVAAPAVGLGTALTAGTLSNRTVQKGLQAAGGRVGKTGGDAISAVRQAAQAAILAKRGETEGERGYRSY